MKKLLLEILNKYLQIFPEEIERQGNLIEYLNSHESETIVDWNNFDGHIVAGGFIYAKDEKKFLVLYHRDLNMYLYPGGHVDVNDINVLEAAKREVEEETGLTNMELLGLSNDEMIPIDIDTHMIGYNNRLNLPEHYHFDFRYLFTVDKTEDISIDSEELTDYQWISLENLSNDSNYGCVAVKIERILNENMVLKK